MDQELLKKLAFETGHYIQSLTRGYYSHIAAISISKDPRAYDIMPPILSGHSVPIGIIKRKDNTFHAFHFTHFLDLIKTDPIISEQMEHIWFTGTILTICDRLEKNNYFDRAPELELLRYIRHGIAHGNRFRIDHLWKLDKFPAHNKFCWVKSDTNATFEISENCQNQKVLFEFMQAGDLLDLLMSISIYLIRMGDGLALRPA